ncbi:MAG: hypothetical protein ACLT8E_01810 [Akkermansia sp.]
MERGDFLEYAEVHGNRYGTLKADILNLLEQGKNVVMDIDVRGPPRSAPAWTAFFPNAIRTSTSTCLRKSTRTAFAAARRMKTR